MYTNARKIKLLKEIQETLKGKHLRYSRRFKARLEVDMDNDTLLCGIKKPRIVCLTNIDKCR